MPNWCRNRLTIEGAPPQVAEFVRQAQGPKHRYREEANAKSDNPEVSVLAFHRIVPIPKEVLAMPYDPHGHAAETILWGVKCGALEPKIVSQFDGFVGYQFDTPWGPPFGFLIRASQRFSDLMFSLHYDEPNCEVYGRTRIAAGEIQRMSVLNEIPLNGPGDAERLKHEILTDTLPTLAFLAEKFGGIENVHDFVSRVDGSLESTALAERNR